MADRSYSRDEAAEAIRTLAANAADRNPDFYAKVGRIVRGLEGGYASNHVGQLADALKRLGLDGLNTSTLHKAEKFASTLTPDQVRTLCRKHVSWRAAARLSSSNLSQARRDALVACVADGRLEPEGLGAAIKRRMDDAATANPRSVRAAADRAAEAIDLLGSVAANGEAPQAVRDEAADALRNLLTKVNGLVS